MLIARLTKIIGARFWLISMVLAAIWHIYEVNSLLNLGIISKSEMIKTYLVFGLTVVSLFFLIIEKLKRYAYLLLTFFYVWISSHFHMVAEIHLPFLSIMHFIFFISTFVKNKNDWYWLNSVYWILVSFLYSFFVFTKVYGHYWDKGYTIYVLLTAGPLQNYIPAYNADAFGPYQLVALMIIAIQSSAIMTVWSQKYRWYSWFFISMMHFTNACVTNISHISLSMLLFQFVAIYLYKLNENKPDLTNAAAVDTAGWNVKNIDRCQAQ